MIQMIKNSLLAIKTAFMVGKTIGEEGKNKEFVKHPIKTIQEVKFNGSRRNSNDKD